MISLSSYWYIYFSVIHPFYILLFLLGKFEIKDSYYMIKYRPVTRTLLLIFFSIHLMVLVWKFPWSLHTFVFLKKLYFKISLKILHIFSPLKDSLRLDYYRSPKYQKTKTKQNKRTLYSIKDNIWLLNPTRSKSERIRVSKITLLTFGLSEHH